jgi:uncharacterized repeat protein (TIGR02543 family)
MKNRSVISLFTLILIIFCLFAACANPSSSASKHDPKSDPDPDPDSGYWVAFQANGGKPAPYSQIIADGGKVVMPPAMTKAGYIFGGWYKEAACTNEWNFATDTVAGDITLYAKWDVNYLIVSFNANGGNPAPNQQTIVYGGKVNIPPAMTKTGYIFGGWYKEAACTHQWNFAADTVTSNIILYAQWYTPIVVSGTTLAEKLQWLSINAASNSGYIIEVIADEELNAQNLFYNGKSNITIQLKGTGSSRVITLWNSGSLFSIGNGVMLILEENLILPGKYNNASLVQVNSGGTLIMNQSVKISGSTVVPSGSSSYGGGGVYVGDGGTFTMNGGEISGNTASSCGGGVYVGDGGTFTMNGGEITGNTASSSFSSSAYGGGVYVSSSGTFTMSGGEITGNTASSGSSSYGGGGVYVGSGTFTMSGGEITGNTTSSSSYNKSGGGGGVYVGSGTFTMSGGEITGNTASSSYKNTSSYGGGVYVGSGTFTMSGGEITGNKTAYGGGVYVGSGTFTMSGGEISGHTTSSYGGGGVYVNSGTFTMSGGEITGNTV